MKRRNLIILFCLWHMTAVAVFLLPQRAWNRAIKQLTTPYVLLTSQWQQWDIFSPDPLRRVSFYSLTTDDNAGAKTLLQLDYAHLPWNARAKELKILGRLQAEWKD